MTVSNALAFLILCLTTSAVLAHEACSNEKNCAFELLENNNLTYLTNAAEQSNLYVSASGVLVSYYLTKENKTYHLHQESQSSSLNKTEL